MEKPSNRNHPVLGRVQQWEDMVCADVVYEGETVGITILSKSEIEPLIDTASEVVRRLPELVRDAKAYAAAQLLELKNGTWLKDEEKPVTPDEFTARMILNSIGVNEDHSIGISFNDGGLFWDHYISVDMDATFQLTSAYIDG